MLSKNKIKYLHSLSIKKHRESEGVFLAEGHKLVNDLLGKMPLKILLATDEYLASHPHIFADEIIPVSERELIQASQLKTPRDVVAVFEMPKPKPLSELSALPAKQLCLALDTVQDPGNLGTIIRLADWFGIEHIFCTTETADAFAPKTIQATMGAIARVGVHYVQLTDFLQSLSREIPIYGTFLEGKNIYDEQLSENGVLIMGNEGQGISAPIENLVTRKIFIPPYPAGRESSESLNVAVATAVACAEFRRQSSGRTACPISLKI